MNEKLRTHSAVLANKYKIADTKLNATMFVVDGDWRKQCDYGPTSFLMRCLGGVLSHIEFVSSPTSVHTPVTWLPLDKTGRCQTIKVYMSEACVHKHKHFLLS